VKRAKIAVLAVLVTTTAVLVLLLAATATPRYYQSNVDDATQATTTITTTALEVTMRDRNSYVGAMLSPWDFIEDDIDEMRATAEFITEPDTSEYGSTQTVEIELTDENGNRTRWQAQLNIVERAELPVIEGVRDFRVGRGTTIAFRAGVTATHSAGEATLEIDSSRVNIMALGTYEVVYIARSPAGQVARTTATVVIGYAVEEDALRLITPILQDIIDDNMTMYEQARAVHTWIYDNITYNFAGPRGTVADVAYQGMNLRRGDCVTFYSIARFMLQQLNVPFVSMQRLSGYTRTTHFWLLVDVGYGWHHFDATNFTRSPRNGFMMTTEDVDGFNPWDWAIDFYAFDPEALPDGVEIV